MKKSFFSEFTSAVSARLSYGAAWAAGPLPLFLSGCGLMMSPSIVFWLHLLSAFMFLLPVGGGWRLRIGMSLLFCGYWIQLIACLAEIGDPHFARWTDARVAPWLMAYAATIMPFFVWRWTRRGSVR